MDRRSWLWLLLLASIWGASYMLIKIGLRDMSPEMVAFARIALAAVVLMPIAAAQGALSGLRGRLGVIAAVGAVQVAGPFLLIPLGEQHIASALAGILVATTPIFTALLAIRLDHEERSEGLRLVGVGVGVAASPFCSGLISAAHPRRCSAASRWCWPASAIRSEASSSSIGSPTPGRSALWPR